ncbi:MAG: hypothetical protein V2J24_11760 [Pseudomonadales bacterium]|nr:hypothetical protein [Pseudomonadales bacterium]
MNPETRTQRLHWSRLRRLFRDACRHGDPTQGAWLHRACSDDAELERILRELLEAAATQRDEPPG